MLIKTFRCLSFKEEKVALSDVMCITMFFQKEYEVNENILRKEKDKKAKRTMCNRIGTMALGQTNLYKCMAS